MARNPAGFLVTSIQDDYEAPPEFHDVREQRRRQQDTIAARQRRQKLQDQRAVAEEQKDQQSQRAIDSIGSRSPTPERRRRSKPRLRTRRCSSENSWGRVVRWNGRCAKPFSTRMRCRR